MKEWGRYQIVGSPDDADLIIELKYWVEHNNGTDVSSFTNTYTVKTQTVSSEIVDPQLKLTIYDAKSKASLWSDSTIGDWPLRETETRKQ